MFRRGRLRPGALMVLVCPDSWIEYSEAPRAVARMADPPAIIGAPKSPVSARWRRIVPR